MATPQQAKNFTHQEWVNSYVEKGTRDVYINAVKSFLRITYASNEGAAF
ncbi:MAG TPA: hypothetical protein VGS11_10215 [Candidatus Bathyarchaeia archaeon]|nr:hypothetical protein [Candidatus Bathyarchaeia archaeon]